MKWPPRYTVLSLLFGAGMLGYMDRFVMASAIPFIAADFGLSPLAMGGVLSAFFVGYALMQIPGGVLADRFGPRVMLLISILWWSLMTACTGWASGLIALVIIRLLFGLGEGPFPASASKALTIWFPPQELGRASGVQLASTAVGATVAPLFVAFIIAHWGWRPVFYVLSVPGLILGILIWRYLKSAAPAAQNAPSMHWKRSLAESLKSPAILWCAACLFFANIMDWGLANWLPTYLLKARGFSLGKMGAFAALISLCGAVGLQVGGYLCDKIFRRALRFQVLIGLGASGLMTGLAASAPTGEWAVVCLMVGFFVSGIGKTALFTLPLILSPAHAVGGAYGIVNTAGQIAGICSPLLVGGILQWTGGNFQIVLYCLVAIALLALFPASRIRQSAVNLQHV